VVSGEAGDDDDILSSGQASPIDSHPPNPLLLRLRNHPQAERSTSDISEYDRRVSEFNQRRPVTKPPLQNRIISWSDPITARGIIDDDEGKKLGASPLGRSGSSDDPDEVESTLVDSTGGWNDTHRARLYGPRRHRSSDDLDVLRGTRILPLDHLKLDVQLCGELLIMKRREQHLANVLACLQALTDTLEPANTALLNDYTQHQPRLHELESRTVVLQQIEAARAKADAMTQETNALSYESAQFAMDGLWHMASQPRQNVFAFREKVFGTGRRLRQGVRGAHGQFNRVQWTIDGKERLVDALGRTESEAEEEQNLPGAHPNIEEDEEVEVVENQTLRPTWILRLFNSWGSRWGTPQSAAQQQQHEHERPSPKVDDAVDTNSHERGLSSSVEACDKIESRSTILMRHHTTT